MKRVTEIRDQLCLILSKYCKKMHGDEDTTRFAKLLMRLPSFRSWSLKGVENLFFTKASGAFDDQLISRLT